MPERPEERLYDVFHRTWWKRNPNWPSGREPGAGRKTYLAKRVIWTEARRIADEYNRTNEPGFLSRKAEIKES